MLMVKQKKTLCFNSDPVLHFEMIRINEMNVPSEIWRWNTKDVAFNEIFFKLLRDAVQPKDSSQNCLSFFL
jgi:hypothetical protein